MRQLTITALALTLAGCGQSGETAKASSSPSPAQGQAAAIPASGAAVRPETRTFRDWYAVCDNGGACAAYSGGSTGWLRIGLDAGPSAQPLIQLGMWPEGEALTGPLVLVIDGKRFAATPSPDDTSVASIASAQVPAVLAALNAGKTLALVAGSQTVEIPTAGSSASLLWIDERQGRLDTVTALGRRGDRPASAVPAAPALPVIAAAPAISQEGFKTVVDPADPLDRPNAIAPAVLEAVPAVKQCRADTDFNAYLQKAVTVDRLSADTELWGVPCDAGAYNFSYAYFITGPNGVDPRQVRFPDRDGDTDHSAEGENDLLVNPEYDPKTRTLSAFAKARGLGDCGVSQTWTWTGQAFVMSREQVMQDCWGMSSEFWPTTFRSR